jgi:hypothetical protein
MIASLFPIFQYHQRLQLFQIGNLKFGQAVLTNTPIFFKSLNVNPHKPILNRASFGLQGNLEQTGMFFGKP